MQIIIIIIMQYMIYYIKIPNKLVFLQVQMQFWSVVCFCKLRT